MSRIEHLLLMRIRFKYHGLAGRNRHRNTSTTGRLHRGDDKEDKQREIHQNVHNANTHKRLHHDVAVLEIINCITRTDHRHDGQNKQTKRNDAADNTQHHYSSEDPLAGKTDLIGSTGHDADDTRRE